ncbi:MAG TPA: ribbon-helix-helix domain-containing protein [Methylomirabilota bacterium]|jgi:predicted DNA-binding ribbon-helix-helix protein|nr:ribbon-helix-helix domain-containing protein [Methylomirabilota bacterium]
MSPDSQKLRKRSVVIQGHRTSLSLEKPFWDALKEIATRRGLSLARLIAEIDAARSGNLSSAARVYVLDAMRAQR